MFLRVTAFYSQAWRGNSAGVCACIYGCMSLCNRDILRFMWTVQDKYVLVTRLCDARMRIRDHYKGDGRSGLGPIPSQFIAE